MIQSGTKNPIFINFLEPSVLLLYFYLKRFRLINLVNPPAAFSHVMKCKQLRFSSMIRFSLVILTALHHHWIIGRRKDALCTRFSLNLRNNGLIVVDGGLLGNSTQCLILVTAGWYREHEPQGICQSSWSSAVYQYQ